MKILKTKFSGYENKVKFSILLILMLLVTGNFIASYFFNTTRQLFLDYQSVNQCYLAKVCRHLILQSPDLSSGLKLLNNQFYQNDDYIFDIIFINDFNDKNLDEFLISDPNLKSAFKNKESYGYYPEIEMQIAFIPLKVDNSGIVESVFILKNRINWFDYLNQASRWDNVFRIAGILSVLVFGYFIIRMIIKPYKNIRYLALNAINGSSIDINDPDYAEKAFGTILTELRKKETELKEMILEDSRKTLGITSKYDYIFGGISSGVIICDREGIIIRINRSAADIFEINNEKASKQHYSEIFSEFKDIKYLISSALNTGKTYSRIELKLRQRIGANKILGATSSLIKDDNGAIIGTAIMLIDLTQIKKIEKEYSYRDKMVSLGEMTAGLAHEIRNSSAAISGFGKLALKCSEDSHRIKDISSNIVREAEEMELLMKRFLTFAKPIQLNRESVNISNLLEDCIKQFQGSYPDGVVKILPSNDELYICVDYQLLKQALYNLITNAYEASEDRTVVLKAKKIRYSNALIINGDLDGFIKLSIADNGCGIEREIIEKIFDPFFTNKDKGTGLGLSLVRKIVSLHDGIIKVHSRKSKGTIITITLPITTSTFPKSTTMQTDKLQHV